MAGRSELIYGDLRVAIADDDVDEILQELRATGGVGFYDVIDEDGAVHTILLTGNQLRVVDGRRAVRSISFGS